jgi:hypothetical protein
VPPPLAFEDRVTSRTVPPRCDRERNRVTVAPRCTRGQWLPDAAPDVSTFLTAFDARRCKNGLVYRCPWMWSSNDFPVVASISWFSWSRTRSTCSTVVSGCRCVSLITDDLPRVPDFEDWITLLQVYRVERVDALPHGVVIDSAAFGEVPVTIFIDRVGGGASRCRRRPVLPSRDHRPHCAASATPRFQSAIS